MLKNHSRSGSSPFMIAGCVIAASSTIRRPSSSADPMGNPRRRRRRSTGYQLRILMTTSIQSPASHPSHKNVATVPATESVVSNNRKTCWPSDNVDCLSATGLRKNSTAKGRNGLTCRLCPNARACKLVCD